MHRFLAPSTKSFTVMLSLVFWNAFRLLRGPCHSIVANGAFQWLLPSSILGTHSTNGRLLYPFVTPCCLRMHQRLT
ncbi:hypothetical protein GGS26DRAFT_574561 [Hypomontagnella submonticulosa]|nr:hypothetical protein GGS26DRAFT_574561 [Hypomontagnella submonticulosa]